jgi:hypothetical protein
LTARNDGDLSHVGCSGDFQMKVNSSRRSRLNLS